VTQLDFHAFVGSRLSAKVMGINMQE